MLLNISGKPWLFLIKGSVLASFQEHFVINILLTDSTKEVAFANIDIGEAFDRLITSLEPFPRVELCNKQVDLKCCQSETVVGHMQLKIILKVYNKCVISALQQYTAAWQAQNGEVMVRNVLSTVLAFAQRLIFALKYFVFKPKTCQIKDLRLTSQ
uniref:Uncharacterized protein n=1 Tax=Cacopsylla melanoneura TaxID=428564 RepID=A0A8D8LD51_9HEMI